MCFSTSASFTASAVIGVISIATFIKAATPAQRVLACMPLFFAIQQCIEGFLWLSLLHAEYKGFYTIAMYAFMVFAQVVWPTMVPLATLAQEPKEGRQGLLRVFLGVGIVTSLLHIYCLLTFGATAAADNHHIKYTALQPRTVIITGNVIYFIAAIVPLFVSGIKGLRWFGVLLISSYLISAIAYRQYVVSVWCFIAAVISVLLYFVIVDINKKRLVAARS